MRFILRTPGLQGAGRFRCSRGISYYFVQKKTSAFVAGPCGGNPTGRSSRGWVSLRLCARLSLWTVELMDGLKSGMCYFSCRSVPAFKVSTLRFGGSREVLGLVLTGCPSLFSCFFLLFIQRNNNNGAALLVYKVSGIRSPVALKCSSTCDRAGEVSCKSASQHLDGEMKGCRYAALSSLHFGSRCLCSCD